jgi:hypothetical protein
MKKPVENLARCCGRRQQKSPARGRAVFGIIYLDGMNTRERRMRLAMEEKDNSS